MPRKSNIIGSLFLIGLGIFLLMNNFSFYLNLGPSTAFFLFGGLSVLGFTYYLIRRSHWWVLIPSSAFLGIGSAALSESLFQASDGFSGLLFFLGFSVGFWLLFIGQKKHWWAGIPAGVLSTLGFVALVDSVTRGSDLSGTILFVGLGLTFGMLWLLRRSEKTGWAIWPAAFLIGFGLFTSAFEPVFEAMTFGWPLILIALGAWMILKQWRQPVSVNGASNNGHVYQNGHSEPEAPPAEREVI